jgi:hypothetical protein
LLPEARAVVLAAVFLLQMMIQGTEQAEAEALADL